MTKHDRILQYIEQLAVGTKISVRGIAKDLQVSEGTAYRAIKDAELQGLVSAVDRVGTVRIERKGGTQIERLTFDEVVRIVEGTVLGGRGGLSKTLHKFIIGAMRVDAVGRYLEAGSLMIVGNREEVQRFSLERGAAVLITGGFEASQEIQNLANERNLPLISCSYDTFTTAAMINRAIYDHMIKKDILFVEDVMQQEGLAVMDRNETVHDYYRMVERTGHGRFPVVDRFDRLVGVVTARDVAEAKAEDPVRIHMSMQPVTVTLRTTVASAAHRMVWEGVEILPVVENRKLIGIISRQDVLKALQLMNRQPQVGQTLEDEILERFEEVVREDEQVILSGEVAPQLTSGVGTLALGALMTLMQHAATLCMQRIRGADVNIENISIYTVKPVPVDARIDVKARILDIGRRFAKLEVEVWDARELSAKALVTAQVMER